MSQKKLEEIVNLRLDEPPDEPWQTTDVHGFVSPPNVRKLTADTIVKWSYDEVENGVHMMNHVSQHTSIPIPQIHRHWHDPDYRRTLTIMDYIPGDTLEVAWPSLNSAMQLWVAQTLRSYVTQLQAVPYPPNWSGAPGPFNQTSTPLACPPMWIFTENGAGPFDSYDAMTRWFDTRRTRLMLHLHEVRRGELPEVCMFDKTLCSCLMET